MSKRADKSAPQTREKEAGPAPAASGGMELPWRATFGVLAVLLIALSWFQLAKIGSRFDGGTNEGFNSYYQQAAADGKGLYREPPVYYATNYPPFSFHLVAWLSKLAGAGVNPTGRWVSVLAFAAIAWWIGLIVHRLTGVKRYGGYAALCWAVWIGAFDPSRIGFNDPHLMGIAINLAAFYLFLRDPESTRSLILSGVVFSLSFFTKQTLIVFPAAVALELFLTSRSRLLVWLGAGAASSVLFLLLTFAVDGRYFFEHLMVAREYSIADMWTNTVSYLTFVQTAFAAALLWALWKAPSGMARMLVFVFAAAHLFGVYLVGGDGAGVNHFYDAMIAIAIICGLLAAGFERAAVSTAHPRAVLACLLIVPFFLSSLLVLPRRIPYDRLRSESVEEFEKEYAADTALVRAQPGPALCESMMLCFDAGKSEIFDAWVADQAIKTGHLDERNLLQLLATHHYGAVVIYYSPAEAIRPAARHRFSLAFMNQLFASYQLVRRDSRYGIFVPKAP